MSQVSTERGKVRPHVVRCDVVPFQQSGVRLFTGVIQAGDLIRATKTDFHRSELAPDDPNQGYQRPPERTRITKIVTYLVQGKGDGLFPTSVLLASRTPVVFDQKSKTIELVLSEEDAKQIIDGQHRIRGFKDAIELKGETKLIDFQLPFVLMEPPNKIVEMNQFRIINGNAKSVNTALVNQILTATVASRGEESVDAKDRWKVAVTYAIELLNKHDESPWFGLIQMADEKKSISKKDGDKGSDKVVRVTSFMTSLRPVYVWLNELGFLDGLSLEEQGQKVYDIVAAYWEAIQEVVPDAFKSPEDYVLQKTPGVFAMHSLLVKPLLADMWRGRQPWTAENFVKFLEGSPEITDAQFWHNKEQRASSYGSMKGFGELANLLRDSIHP